jgi:predicted butyrate kinase (DUF1464 family)
VTPFERIYLSGAGLNRPDVARLAGEALSPLGQVVSLPTFPGAWVKHAAQGSALLADALAGGKFAAVAESLAALGAGIDLGGREPAQVTDLSPFFE